MSISIPCTCFNCNCRIKNFNIRIQFISVPFKVLYLCNSISIYTDSNGYILSRSTSVAMFTRNLKMTGSGTGCKANALKSSIPNLSVHFPFEGSCPILTNIIFQARTKRLLPERILILNILFLIFFFFKCF